MQFITYLGKEDKEKSVNLLTEEYIYAYILIDVLKVQIS